MSYVPKPQFWSRIGSPWLGLGSNLARMNPTASRDLLKPLPALREPIFGPKSQKTKYMAKLPAARLRRDIAAEDILTPAEDISSNLQSPILGENI